MKTIFILGGLLRKNRNGSYRSEQFSYIRILAGYYLYKNLSKKNKTELVVSGGRGIYRGIPGVPLVATVMKRELVELGTSRKEIKVDKTDFTHPELVSLKKLLAKKGSEAFIISNTYHLPRIKTMIDILPELKKLKKIVKLVSAEKIAIKYNKNLENKINKDNEGSKMKKIIALEKKGIAALRSGNYKFKT